MSQIKLDIYLNKELEKTYTAEGYDLCMGTIDDFVEIIDVDKINDNMAIAGMLVKSYSQIKPIITDIFPELTDEEWRRIRMSDLVDVIVQIGFSIVERFAQLKGNGKRA